MAANAFKQACPSCEHGVVIRDAALIGRKIECPKCKYKFLVQKPKGAASDGGAKTKPKGPPPPPTPAAKGKGKPGSLRDFDEDDMEELVSDGSQSKKRLFIGLGLGAVGLVVLILASYVILGKTGSGGGGGAPRVTVPEPVAQNGDPDSIDEKKTDDKKVDPKKGGKTTQPAVDTFLALPPGPELTNLLPNDAEHVFHGFFKDLIAVVSPFRMPIVGDPRVFADTVFRPRLGFAIGDIDDLIRADRFTPTPWTYTVIHFKEQIDEKAVTEAFGLKRMPTVKGHEYFRASKPNPWFDQLSRVAVGVPQWLRHLERENRPMFVRFHNPQTLIVADETPLKELLRHDLQFPLQSGASPAPAAKIDDPVAKGEGDDKKEKKKDEVGIVGKVDAAGNEIPDPLVDSVWAGTESRPGPRFGPLTFTFNRLGEVLIENPNGAQKGRYMITGGQIQMHHSEPLRYTGVAALTPTGYVMAGTAQVGGLTWKFAVRRIRGPESVVVVGKTVEKKVKKSDLPQVRSKSYLTIKPSLKDMLDRLEASGDSIVEKPLYSTATELEPARVPIHQLPSDAKGKFFWRGKQVWDLALLLDEKKPRIILGGSSMMQRDARNYQYRAEFECGSETDARDVQRFADDSMAPELARNVERYLQHKIDIPRADMVMEGSELVDGSRWAATLRDQSVDVRVDLVLDNAVLSRMQGLVGLFAMAARSEVNLAAEPRGRHLLGKSAATMAERGIGERQVPAGTFPPGTFKKPATSSRGGNSPYYRLSWMTALLPYLGHDNLAGRIDYTAGWRDPSNWMAARTLVPEFQDASYPLGSRYVPVPGLGVAPAATHVVGIAGVGLDAADYNRDDPSTTSKRGVFGYDRSATLTELQQGHGAANTIMMMQIPHDGLTGVSPWIAGGGSTLRGVPEKDCLAPFVLTTDRDGKAITQKGGRRGTYAVMADGSVRFLDATLPDDIVKAMCTVHGPAAPIDFFSDERVMPIPDPGEPKAAPKVAATPATPPTVTPPVAAPPTASPLPATPPAVKNGPAAEKKKS